MRALHVKGSLLGAVVATAAVVGCNAVGASEDRFAEIPAGTSLTVRLEQGFDTRSTVAGEAVGGSVADAVTHSGSVVVPAGSPVRGSVVAISEDPPSLTLHFHEVEIQGASYPVEAGSATIALRKRSEMRKEGAKIGGGAAAGALIGGLVGGDVKGAAIGAGAGAAAGTGVALATKARWAELGAGATVAVPLKSSLQIALPPEPPAAE